MRDAYVDVTLELTHADLDAVPQADWSAFVFERMERTADQLCDSHSARLRTDARPEIIVSEAQRRSDGAACLLFAARWPCIVPDHTHTPAGHAR